jgi:hypothetical protein
VCVLSKCVYSLAQLAETIIIIVHACVRVCLSAICEKDDRGIAPREIECA